MSYVEGSYDTPHEVILAVKRLKEEGYRPENIRLISNTEVHDSFVHQLDIEVHVKDPYEDGVDADSSLWEKIKDAFSTVDDYGEEPKHPEDDPLFYYRANIDAGKIIILINEPYTRTDFQEDSKLSTNQKKTFSNPNLADDPKDDVLLDQKKTSDYDKRK